MKPRLHSWTIWAATLLAPLVCVSTPLLAQTALAPASASAQPARTTHTYTLANGMQLWVRPDHRGPARPLRAIW